MRPTNLLTTATVAAALISGCGVDPCPTTHQQVAASNTCDALRCNSPDAITDWSVYEDVENDQWDGFCAGDENCEEELWYGRQVNYAECSWDCIELPNGTRAMVTQTYRKVPGECIELIEEVIYLGAAECDSECETVSP